MFFPQPTWMYSRRSRKQVPVAGAHDLSGSHSSRSLGAVRYSAAMRTRRSVALIPILFASLSIAHSGGLDETGRYVEKATNQRHSAPARDRKLATCDLTPAPKEGDEGVFYGPVVHVTDGDTLNV